MCFYYNLTKLAQRYKERARNTEILIKMDLVNGFSYPQMPVITSEGVELMSWGLIPAWAPNKEIRQHTLNARMETIFDKPSFKEPVFSSRCLIPANGFFEWKHTGKNAQPFFIHLKNQDCFCFAGIYDEWVCNDTGEHIKSYSIVTSIASESIRMIHSKDRMPVMLTVENEFNWLQANLKREEIRDLLQPLPDAFINTYPINPFNKDNPVQPNITRPFLMNNQQGSLGF